MNILNKTKYVQREKRQREYYVLEMNGQYNNREMIFEIYLVIIFVTIFPLTFTLFFTLSLYCYSFRVNTIFFFVKYSCQISCHQIDISNNSFIIIIPFMCNDR